MEKSWADRTHSHRARFSFRVFDACWQGPVPEIHHRQPTLLVSIKVPSVSRSTKALVAL